MGSLSAEPLNTNSIHGNWRKKMPGRPTPRGLRRIHIER
jgi:hypothetical protein